MVAHPGRQHSHQAALALYKRNLLGEYWTGVPAGRVTDMFPSLGDRFGIKGIPSSLIRWWPLAPLMRRGGQWIHPNAGAAAELLSHRWFDRFIASRIRRGQFNAIVGYESATAEAFAAARRAGVITILDAPAVHEAANMAALSRTTPARLHATVMAGKQLELELADAVLVTSPLARDTYIAAGVPSSKIHVVTLGVDLDLFLPDDRVTADGFTFAFAGSFIGRKGIDLLLEAFRRTRDRSSTARLRLFGSGANERALVAEGVSLEGRLSHADLARELRTADCFVLPSRIDSYGLVVAEALASGVPVIVSDAVGAKELIRPGANGWIVPAGDAEALADRMTWFVQNRDQRDQWRGAARQSVLALGWSAYHERFAAAVESLLKVAR